MNLRLKVPPAVVMLVAGSIMWLISEYLIPGKLTYDFPNWVEQLMIGIGVLMGVAGVIQFALSKTTVNPHTPQKTNGLVLTGIYQFSRNPMYLGMLILIFVFGMKLGNIVSILTGITFFVWYMNEFQIKPEEQILLEKFGDEYREFQKRVRRWI